MINTRLPHKLRSNLLRCILLMFVPALLYVTATYISIIASR